MSLTDYTKFVKEFQENDKLDGTNHVDWLSNMNRVITLCNLRKRLETTDPPVTEDEINKENLLQYFISTNVKKEIRLDIREKKTAKEMWDHIDKTQNNKSIMFQLRHLRDILDMRMKEDEDPNDFVRRYKAKISLAEASGLKMIEDDTVKGFLLLNTLPERYNQTALTFSATNQVPSIVVIEGVLKDAWNNTPLQVKNDTTESHAMIASTAHRHQSGYRKREMRTCGVCKKPGWHLDKDCHWLPENAHKRQKRHDAKIAKIDTKPEEQQEEKEKPVFSYMAVIEEKIDSAWILDSGATEHMTGSRKWFTDLRKIPAIQIYTGKGVLASTQIGTITIWTGDMSFEIEALYVPGLNGNLMSIGKIASHAKNYTIEINATSLLVRQGQTIIQHAVRTRNSLYELVHTTELPGTMIKEHAFICNTCSIKKSNPKAQTSQAEGASMEVWHRRMAHVNLNDLRILHKGDMVKIDDPATDWGIYFCDACIYAKHHAEGRAQQSVTRSTQPLELIHSDLVGPLDPAGRDGVTRVLTFIDNFSRKTSVYLIKNKEAATIKQCFNEYMTYAERETGLKIKKMRIDGGSEYKADMAQLLRMVGIRVDITNPDRPHENGVAERYNRTLLEGTRAMIASQRVSKELWPYAIQYVCYIRNALPHSALDGLTPYEVYYKKKPDLTNVRVFGCAVYSKRTGKLKKLDDRSQLGIFIGFAEGTRGWKILTSNNRITTSKDCIFVEAASYIPKEDIENYIIETPWKSATEPGDYDITTPCMQENTSRKNPSLNVSNDRDIDEDNTSKVVPQYEIIDSSNTERNIISAQASISDLDINEKNAITSEKDRLEHPQPLIKKVTVPSHITSNTKDTKALRRSSRISALMAEALEINGDIIVPKTYKAAMESPESKYWTSAIDAELKSIEENETWIQVDQSKIPNNASIIQSKLVFALKKNELGHIIRFKARLCARGDMQEEGIDYEEVFSPTIRLESLRVLFAIIAHEDIEAHQIDMTTAFLNAYSDQPILMRLPPLGGTKGPVVQLRKSLYGLKQSGRLWWQLLRSSLLKLGYTQNPVEPSIWMKRIECRKVYLGIYVDDIVIGASACDIQQIKSEICNMYKSTDGGELHHMLGLKIARNRAKRSITVSQESYIEEILGELDMHETESKVSPEWTPADQFNSGLLDKEMAKIYRSVNGKLIWISRATRPDITYNAHRLSKQLREPRQVDWLNMKKLVRYLSGTRTRGIELGGDLKLEAYCDANWITPGDPKSRSISGYLFLLMGPISWKTEMQTIVAESTQEAEYVALNSAGKEAVSLIELMHYLGYEQKLTIMCDNKAAIAMVKNTVWHGRTKHIRVKGHWIREEYENKTFNVQYINTKEQLADFLTKPLLPKHHMTMCDKVFARY